MAVKEKLQEALAEKANNVKSFVWRGEKIEVNGQLIQDEHRMIDCSVDELRGFLNHCNMMLHNSDKSQPGRYMLLDIIEEQRDKCNTELYLRYLEKELKYPRFLYRNDLDKAVEINKDQLTKESLKEYPIETLTNGLPLEFAKIPIKLVLDGCVDALGKFNNQHITLTFILKRGLWFTPQEMKDLTEKDVDGNIRNRLDVVRERLGLRPNSKLYVNSRGLTYNQLRAMINLRSKRYAELTTEQLTALRDKVLFLLEEEVKYHIEQWEKRISQIKEVAEYNEYTL